jgi:ATP-dependent DNA ligase
MASAQAAQPIRKNATKIPPRKASARANSTFVLAVDTPPMEARAAQVIPCDEERWQCEPKWDGFRCLAFKSGDAIDLRAKSGKPLGRYFPEVVSLLRDISAPQFVVDGELVIAWSQGVQNSANMPSSARRKSRFLIGLKNAACRGRQRIGRRESVARFRAPPARPFK